MKTKFRQIIDLDRGRQVEVFARIADIEEMSEAVWDSIEVELEGNSYDLVFDPPEEDFDGNPLDKNDLNQIAYEIDRRVNEGELELSEED